MNNIRINDEFSISTQLTRNVNKEGEMTVDNIESIPQRNQIETSIINEEAIQQYNIKKMTKGLSLPTTDNEIKMKLRQLGEPIILFGEKTYERAERLKEIVEQIIQTHKGITENLKKIFSTSNQSTSNTQQITDEEFYIEGTKNLLNMRKEILMYSLPRSAYRLSLSKQRELMVSKVDKNNEWSSYLSSHSSFEFTSSQIADERGCSKGSIAPLDELYGVANWSGNCTIFSTKDLHPITRLVGHTDRVNSLIFNPGYKNTINEKGPNVLTASNDCTLRLWSLDTFLPNQRSFAFKGHEDKVNYAEFHPLLTIIGSCSNDRTFRIWDIVKREEVLLQEGHTSGVTTLSFQNDGALVATGDLGGIGLVWDLRSGKNIRHLLGHAKQIMKIKFAKNCYEVISVSEDNSIRVWDLRKDKTLFTIPAHKDAICDIQLDKSSGDYDNRFALTASFDSTIKMWDMRDWALVNTYQAMIDDKFTSVDISSDGKKMITTSLGKTIKMWELL